MTAKKYLSELQMIRVKIEQLREQKHMYLNMATSITVPLNPIKVQSSSTADRMGDNVAKAVDIDEKIDEELASLLERQHEVIRQIRDIHNVKYMQLLFKVYVQEKSIRTASFEMNMSYPYTIELHKKALAEFETIHADMLAADEMAFRDI